MKAHEYYLLMSIDKRQKVLRNLRKTNILSLRRHARSWGLSTPFPLHTTEKSTTTR